ncbi:alpha/beta hydrolase [Staphylococcus chromogenes]|uniref:alpha/beta hydrolase n=1 Tax=Staphylococcus chromogenes TaxID=46126 RepID=UPI0015F786A1|nr:alpha/beta hydrolase [Staphylococcus chromogenes]MCE4966297.1 alpha/beta hydrolase [Staphylococcus chromogenes]
MKKRIIGLLILIITVLIIAVVVVSLFQKRSHWEEQNKKQYVQEPTPTLFLHGYGGTKNSMKYLINQAEARGVTKDIVVAHVSRDGEVTFDGKISKGATNPIVQIVLDDNTQGDLNENALWIRQVLEKLQKDYHVKQFNFVAHSMGNVSFAQYMIDYGRDASLPQLKKEVNLAGTFNGVLGMNEEVNEIQVDRNGKPSDMNPPYQEFMQLKSIYKDKNIDVLNMYGDLLDGTHSDGRVSNSSSKSLKYLLGDSPKSYQEVKYEGKEAQHSALHENEEVAQQMIRFLWEK